MTPEGGRELRDARSSDGGGNASPARSPGGWFEPLWRRVLVAGWGVFVVSFLLPTCVNYVRVPSPSGDSSLLPFGDAAGWEAFLWALVGTAGTLGTISAATNLVILGSALHGKWSPGARWPVLVLTGATLLNGSFWLFWVVSESDKVLQVGYFAWVASFACVTAALWLRGRAGAASGA